MQSQNRVEEGHFAFSKICSKCLKRLVQTSIGISLNWMASKDTLAMVKLPPRKPIIQKKIGSVEQVAKVSRFMEM